MLLHEKFNSFTIYRLLFIHKGFTLAEVMVVLAILGILSAILIPSAINIAPTTNKVMFRKAYSTLELAISQLINDDVNYPEGHNGFNYTTHTGSVPPNVNKFCYLITEALNTVTSYCPSNTASGWGMDALGTFKTTDGIQWTIFFPGGDNAPNTQFPVNANSYSTVFLIEVNGSKGPNCTTDYYYSYGHCPVMTNCSSHPDMFAIGVRYDGGLKVGMGGDACATYILSNPSDNK